MKVVFSDRAYAAVMAETTEKIQTETGGLFLGWYEDQVWYVIEAIDPGPKSIFEVAYFEYDRRYTEHLINKIANLYRQKLELVGLWHRHPGSLDVFSATDDGTNYKYAQMRPHGAISMLVNVDPVFRTTMYHVEGYRRYRKIPVEVGDGLIPERLLEYKHPEDYLKLMDRLTAPARPTRRCTLREILQGNLSDLRERLCTEEVAEPQADEQTVQDHLINGLIGDIEYLSEYLKEGLSVTLREKYLSLSQRDAEGVCKMFFVYLEAQDRIAFEYNGACYYYNSGLLQRYHESAASRPAQRTGIICRVVRRERNGGK